MRVLRTVVCTAFAVEGLAFAACHTLTLSPAAVCAVQLINQEMGCDDLPKGLCRPSMGRIASPRIRKECQRFPVVAESIVKANGLKLEEFNR